MDFNCYLFSVSCSSVYLAFSCATFVSWIYKPLVIIIAPLTVRFGLYRLFCALGKLRIAIINHSLKRFPVVNCGSVTGGDFPPIPGSTFQCSLRTCTQSAVSLSHSSTQDCANKTPYIASSQSNAFLNLSNQMRHFIDLHNGLMY